MDVLQKDIERLHTTMRVFFQTMKRPAYWQQITSQAGIIIDRPSAVILHHLVLHNSRPYRVIELAEQFGIEAPSVTRTTQALERAGYIERVADSKDRRAVGLQATVLGNMVSERLWAAQQATLSRAFADWKPSERQQFIQLFERFAGDVGLTFNHIQTKEKDVPHV